MPKISIIIPAFNAAESIHRCVESIIFQTFTDFELLIIDDGSTDSTGMICDNYAKKDKRIFAFHKENGGVSSARNLGLNNAKGDWIAFCDSDDWVEDRWLEHFVNNIYDAEIVVQGFYCDNWPDGKKNIGISDYYGSKNEFIIQLHQNSIVGYVWCKLFKRSYIQEGKIRFNENYKILEDEDFVMQYLVRVNKISNTKIGYYNYSIPDHHHKYGKFDLFDCSIKLYTSTRRIFGNESLSNPLAIRYFYLSTASLLSKYKKLDKNRLTTLKTYLDFYEKEIHVTKFSRTLFKPLSYIIFKENLYFTHILFSVYGQIIRILNK